MTTSTRTRTHTQAHSHSYSHSQSYSILIAGVAHRRHRFHCRPSSSSSSPSSSLASSSSLAGARFKSLYRHTAPISVAYRDVALPAGQPPPPRLPPCPGRRLFIIIIIISGVGFCSRISSINFQFIRFIYLLIFAIAVLLLTPPSFFSCSVSLLTSPHNSLYIAFVFALFRCALRLLFSLLPLLLASPSTPSPCLFYPLSVSLSVCHLFRRRLLRN